MTDRSRRKELRQEAIAEYRDLTRKVKELNRSDDPIKIQQFIEENLDRGNELYSRVKRKLDGTSADARHMKELVNLCHDSCKRIIPMTRQFDLRKIILSLKRDHDEEEGNDKQDFLRMVTERHVKTFLHRPPTFEFFYGALKSEELQIKPKKKKEPRQKIVATQAVMAKERDMEVEVEQDSTPKEVELINERINRLARNKTEGIPFFKTLIDPNSFTLTVENIFHTSFLVKEGRVGVKRDKSKRPVLVVDQEVERPAVGEGNQSILSFSMKDYQNWIRSKT